MGFLKTLKTNAQRVTSRLGYDKEGVTWIEWALVGLIALFCLVCFHYVDMDSIVDNSVLFARSIYRGDLLHFYEYSVQNASTVWAANYEIIVYIVVCIWNAPLLLIDLFRDVPYLDSFYCIVWSKLMLPVFMAGTALVIARICRYLNLSRKRSALAAFFFSSSLILLFFTLVISQIEILSLFFMLLGCYYYLKEDYKKFVLFFAIAIPLKMFAIFIFIPMVLLREKKIFKIIGYLICGFSLNLVCKLIFMGSATYKAALGSTSKNIIEGLLSAGIPLGANKVPLFLFIYMGICIFCYIKRADTLEKRTVAISYLPFAVFALFFISASSNTYWSVLMIPFLALTIIFSSQSLKTNLFLEMGIATGFLLWRQCGSEAFRILGDYCDPMFLNHFFPVKEGMQRQFDSVCELWEHLGIQTFAPAFLALFVVCAIAFLLINSPTRTKFTGNQDRLEYSVIWARMGILIVMVAAVTLPLLKTVPDPALSLTAAPVAVREADLMKENYQVTQQFSFEEDQPLSTLTLRFENKADGRRNMGYITVAILDQAGNQVYSQELGTSLITSKEDTDFKLKNFTARAGEVYTIRLTGVTDQDRKRITPMTTESQLYDYPVSFNGQSQESNLYLILQ